MLLLLQYAALLSTSSGLLFPRDSETRESFSLDGLWDFSVGVDNPPPTGNAWTRSAEDIPIRLMPVPSSFNDITTSWELRDFFGVVWYRKKFFVSEAWEGQRVWVRFGSVCHKADVTINGIPAVTHEGGHLPFQAEVTSLLLFGLENTITVGVDNSLTPLSTPQGVPNILESGRIINAYAFDFLNYAGIDRPVTLYTTPDSFVGDITVDTHIDGINGVVRYAVDVVLGLSVVDLVRIRVLDRSGRIVATGTGLGGTLVVPEATFWWPLYMDENPGYLYKLQVEILDSTGNLLDKYTQPFGIRTITWDSDNVFINNKPIYFRGFGRHEESAIKGTGLDLSTILRDINLIKWFGANAVRSSNFPYSEEFMDLADSHGIMVVAECSAVNTDTILGLSLDSHSKALKEMVLRDRNRPSVVMWSVVGDAGTNAESSVEYFETLVAQVKEIDSSRPVTAVSIFAADVDLIGGLLDVALFTSFSAWDDGGVNLDVISPSVTRLAEDWHSRFNIPVVMAGYGADSMEGLHFVPHYIWSEDYQAALLSYHFQAFDGLRQNSWFVGEFIWCFADFKTKQDFLKVGGTKKGVVSRNRQPKSSAFLLRERYWRLGSELDGVQIPNDICSYASGVN